MSSNSRVKKGMKPMLGSLTVVGKDCNKRSIVLPTNYDVLTTNKVNEVTLNNKEKRWASFMGKVVSLFNKNKMKEKLQYRYAKINASRGRNITMDYMTEVDRILLPLQYKHNYHKQ